MVDKRLRTFEINRWESRQPKFDENAEVSEGSEGFDGVNLRQELPLWVVNRLRGRTIATSRKCDAGLGGSLKSGVVFMMSP